MASIITATTTSGLTQSADNSGVLQLASGTGNLVTVPSVTGTAMVSGNMPAFSAYGTVAQSFTTGTFIKVNFDTEDFDTNNNFASSRFTPTVAGYYQINATTSSSGTGTSGWGTAIYKNGTAYGYAYVPNANIGVVVNISRVVYLNGSTDYVEVYAINNNTTQNNQVGNSYSYFSGVLVRGA